MEVPEEFSAKVIIVGGMATGKSSLMHRFVENKFLTLPPTAGVDFKVKTVDVRGNKIKLQLWDTAGQERAQSVARSYYRESAAALIVYDLTDRVSFGQAQKWILAVRDYSGNSEIVLTLVGTKKDVEDRRVVSKEEGEAFARERNISYVEVSAKTGENVDFAFSSTAAAIVRKVDRGALSFDEPLHGIRRVEKRTGASAPDATSRITPSTEEQGWCCL